jgi:thiosulfate/3-mercaptopyruvate sulfurtransferase
VGPLVSTAWLADRLGDPGLVALDSSWYLPQAGRDPRAEYLGGHIPFALWWDLDRYSDHETDLPHMLPRPDTFAADMGALGIGSDAMVVAYDTSGANGSAGRAWWQFRAMGHDRVAVLDGGLGAWKAEGRPVATGEACRPPAEFRATPRPAMVRSRAELERLLREGSVQVLDARAPGRFAGTDAEPRPGVRSGHIPGSLNLPFDELTGPGGRLLPAGELRQRFQAAGLAFDRPVVALCGSGTTACALVLGLEVVGFRDVAVYDGSWAEWGREGGT